MLLILSFFTSFAILEGNAVENISVSAKGFENTVIIEFKNGEQNTAKIKTINIWLASGDSFKSFKAESGWSGQTYGSGQGLTFSTSDVLNPGESVKFGAITSKKMDAINWKVIDENENEIGPAKIVIMEISQTSVIIQSENVTEENVQQTGESLYGTKKFIPENLRTGANMRLVGNGFSSEQTHQFYLNDEFLKSAKSDEQGNFITTIRIPDTVDVGLNEFKIINEFGDLQISSIIINEQKNRLIKVGQVIQEFKITDIPQSVILDETLSISGVGQPNSPVMITIKNEDVMETIQIVDIGVNGEWNFQRPINANDELGDRTIIIRNDFNNISKTVSFVTSELFTISVFTTTTDLGDVFILTGTAQPNKDLTLAIKDPNDDFIRFDILKIDETGVITYEFPRNESFNDGTYVLKATQDDITQVSLFTLGTTSYDRVVVYLEKMNFKANSKAKLTILGPPSTELTLNIFDHSDSRKFTESIKTNSVGTKTFTVDLTGYSSGVYKAVVSNPSYQDTAEFSVGLSSGSGTITFNSTQTDYSPGESILIIGNTGPNSILNIFLISPNGEIVNKIESFADKEGVFTTEMLGIPSNAASGIWQIKAQSGLDHHEVEINVATNNN
jgi:hypothetical protein